MNSLDLDNLRSFVAVVEAASVSRAAEAVGRTQSAVSLQLARLERALGKVLVKRRQGRVLGLTEDGRELLPYARRLVDLSDAAFRAVARPAVAGRVRLGVPADFMDAAFPESLRRFQHAHGGIAIEVVSDVSEALRERVRAGSLDLAFFRRLPGAGDGEAVARQPLIWAAGPTAAVPPPDEALPLVLFPEGCVFRARALAALEAAGRCWRLAYVCPSLDSVRAALRAGLGFSALPAAPAADLEAAEGTALPPLGDVELALAIGREGGRAARLLAEHIRRQGGG